MLGCIKNRETEGEVTFELSFLNVDDDDARVYISNYTEQTRNFTLQSKHVYTERFDTAVEVIGSTLSRKGIKVESDRHLLVYGSSRYNQYGLGGFVSLPISHHGYLYYIVTGDVHGEVLIVGVWPDTKVEVKLHLTSDVITYNDTTYINGSAITETLDEYHTMQIYSTGDMTGTEIRSSEPVSVFTGSKLIGTYPTTNHMVDQLPPLNLWGKTYVTVPPPGYIYTCKLTSGSPNTIVTYKCDESWEDFLVLPEAGSYQTIDFNKAACLLSSNEPILVTMIISKYTANPAMVIMSPLDDVTGEFMTYVPGMLVSAQLVIISNSSITIDPNRPLLSTVCPGHLDYCITYLDNLIGNQTYTVSSQSESFVAAGFVYGRISTWKAACYSLFYRTSGKAPLPRQQEDPRVFDNMTTTVLPDTIEGSASNIVTTKTMNLNKTCLCYNYKKNNSKEIANLTQMLKETLFVNPITTNKYIRSLTSAEDPRTSSKLPMRDTHLEYLFMH
ncbi:uncharacterized protein LOC117343397 [Pecten maximus]|uniref:uncharacterized protein LOC117343397 n=1 Tax=Pecten maximus TaxID=6579 RepID=UPI0014590C05|nr:uncharacterized protein LOC117343397 [Pecten maximus]